MKFSHNKLAGVTDTLWELSIVNESEKVMQTLDSKGNEDNKSEFIGLPAGKYYVIVKHYSWTKDYINTQYNLSVLFTPSEYYEKEFNNNSDEPNLVELNKEYTGQLSSSDDEDFYTFKTSYNGNVILKFNHTKLNGVTDTLWDVYIQNQDGKIFQQVSSNGNEDKKSISIGLPTGTYIVRVKHRDWGKDLYLNIPYQISANFTKSELYEKEFNNNSDEPNTIDLNKAYTGALNSSDDEDFYTFTTTANGNIQLNFNHTKFNGITDTLWDVLYTKPRW